jgi:hypothetical protein
MSNFFHDLAISICQSDLPENVVAGAGSFARLVVIVDAVIPPPVVGPPEVPVAAVGKESVALDSDGGPVAEPVVADVGVRGCVVVSSAVADVVAAAGVLVCAVGAGSAPVGPAVVGTAVVSTASGSATAAPSTVVAQATDPAASTARIAGTSQ